MSFNVWTFLFEIVNFVVLAYVLHRLLYRPLREAVQRRREAAAQAMTQAAEARGQAAALEQQLRERLAGLEDQRLETMRQAAEQARVERQRLLGEAEEAVRRRQEDASQSLERERAEAWRALEGEAQAHAMELARRLLREATGRSLDQQLALRLAEELQHLPDSEIRQARRGWRPGDGAVLETAGELDGAVLQQLTDAAGAVLDTALSLDVQLRPALLGGARLRLGGRVYDASLQGQLNGALNGPQEDEPCPTASGD